MAQEYKYYHGETANPFNEVNDQQGLWCMRYNEVAAMLWDFEYHWANGWDKYSKLKGRNPAYYFELYKQPQQSFKNMQEALQRFAQDNYSHLLYLGSPRWVQYVYDNAMDERFYQPTFNVVPADEIPSYLHWYKGEANNPYTHERPDSTKGFWWNFEFNWYKCAKKLGRQEWKDYLHSWFVNRVWERSCPMPTQQMQEFIRAYEAGVQPTFL